MKRLQEAIANIPDDKPTITLAEARAVADSVRATLRTKHRARRRHGSETIFNQKVIDSANRTLQRFKGNK